MQTADFFTPIVDDPYWFGRIAATNALSDVYAMGGTPGQRAESRRVPARRCWGPTCCARSCAAAPTRSPRPGASIVGGHSIDDPEPKYGLAVTGIVDPRGGADQRGRPRGRRAGADQAARRGRRWPRRSSAGWRRRSWSSAAIAVMTTLNDVAGAQARAAGASALTDVTGFGLLGHVHELAAASGWRRRSTRRVPAIDGVLELLPTSARWPAARGATAPTPRLHDLGRRRPEPVRRLACDAMTSGGLLARASTTARCRRRAAAPDRRGGVARFAAGVPEPVRRLAAIR